MQRDIELEDIYKPYFPVVYRYILSLSRDPVIAEEVTQQAFFKALEKIDDFRGECSVCTWLCQIAKNAYLRKISKPFGNVTRMNRR